MNSAFASLPKIELHLHLDCSLSYEVAKVIDPSLDFETYRESFIALPKCTDLMDYLTRAIKGFQLMQTPEQLRLVTLDLFQQLEADNVIYAEIRFAPLLHLEHGMTPQAVVQTVNEAVTEGMLETGIQAGLILCTLRHFDEAKSMETVQLAEQFKGTNVVGFDIAADEAGYPIDAHKKAFNYAKAKGLGITAHAGEACGADSVWETLAHFHPSRIGHGVRSMEDVKLLDYLKKEGIHLEVCPTSNVQTNVVDAIENHPADQIYRHGISMSVNTDARTISDTTLGKEYQLLQHHFNWGKAHFLRCNLEAINHAFTSEDKKDALRQRIMEAYA